MRHLESANYLSNRGEGEADSARSLSKANPEQSFSGTSHFELLSLPDTHAPRQVLMARTRLLQKELGQWGNVNIAELAAFLEDNKKFVNEIAETMLPAVRKMFISQMELNGSRGGAEWLVRSFKADGIYGPKTVLIHRAYINSPGGNADSLRAIKPLPVDSDRALTTSPASQARPADSERSRLAPDSNRGKRELSQPPASGSDSKVNPSYQAVGPNLAERQLVAPPGTNRLGETYYVSRRPRAVEEAVSQVLNKSFGKFPREPILLESHQVTVEQKGVVKSLTISKVDVREGVGAVIEGELDGKPRALAYFYEPSPRIVFAPRRTDSLMR